jgi:hypothetical protein
MVDQLFLISEILGKSVLQHSFVHLTQDYLSLSCVAFERIAAVNSFLADEFF